jgi:CRISPR system Cascade subunit CasA
MDVSFDLLREPWIACIGKDGRPIELGLRDALVRAHELRELAGESPLVTAALYRLLLAVLHRVFGPADQEEWGRLWEAGRWDAAALDPYFARWRHRFDLFHPERHFYQAADDRVKPKSVVSMIHDVASGNNATLFDHHTEADGMTLTPSQAARMLVAAQAFGLAGLSGLPQKFTDGSCTRGVIFLAAGETLFETLALNCVSYPDNAVMPCFPDDRPCWEMDDPYTPDRSIPRGYLDYLTWQNRRMLLLPESLGGGVVVRRMTMAPALRLDSTVQDPMKHYRLDEKRGPVILRFREERALWRDSAALFRLHGQADRPPRVFHWLADLIAEDRLPKQYTPRYLALGMANDQAKVEFYRSERMPLPLDYLKSETLVESLATALQMAEDTARQLWGAASTLATEILYPAKDPGERLSEPQRQSRDALVAQWAVERRYWSRLEVPFRRTLVALPIGKESALESWRTTLIRTAREAFDPVTDSLDNSPRTLKAMVHARGQMEAGLAKALPEAAASNRKEE